MARFTRMLVLGALVFAIAARPALAGQRTSAQKLEDRWVTTKIDAEYFLDHHLKAQDIQVSTVHGLVTLLGTVPDARSRNQAVAIARATDGVKNVVDMLTVAGTPGAPSEGAARGAAGDQADALLTSDPAIASQVKLLLALDTHIQPPAVHVSVAQGVVTLTGTVGPIAHDRAIELARTIRGVSRVDDRMTVK
jgi:hyperosmotically inducible protein